MEVVREIPVVTRTYVLGAMLTTAACALDLISPFSLYFSWKMVFQKYQFWRLFTNFFFFGSRFSLDFLFHMFFLVRYCRQLEEGSFRDKTADFFYMIFFGATLMLLVAPLVNLHFLGSSLTFMMVYLWGRRNPFGRLNFLGLFTFTAPYLPWVLFSFSVLLGNDGLVDLLGICVGHLYYFLEDVYPRMVPSRVRILKTPKVVELLFASDENDLELEDDDDDSEEEETSDEEDSEEEGEEEDEEEGKGEGEGEGGEKDTANENGNNDSSSTSNSSGGGAGEEAE